MAGLKKIFLSNERENKPYFNKFRKALKLSEKVENSSTFNKKAVNLNHFYVFFNNDRKSVEVLSEDCKLSISKLGKLGQWHSTPANELFLENYSKARLELKGKTVHVYMPPRADFERNLRSAKVGREAFFTYEPYRDKIRFGVITEIGERHLVLNEAGVYRNYSFGNIEDFYVATKDGFANGIVKVSFPPASVLKDLGHVVLTFESSRKL